MILLLLKQSRHVEDEGIGRDGRPENPTEASNGAEGSDDGDTTKIETQVYTSTQQTMAASLCTPTFTLFI